MARKSDSEIIEGHPPRRKNGCKKNGGEPHAYRVIERNIRVVYEDRSYRKAGVYIGEDCRCADCGKYVMVMSKQSTMEVALEVLTTNSQNPWLEIRQ